MIRRLASGYASGSLVVFVVLVVVFAALVEQFASVQNLTNLLHAAAPLIVVTAGLTFAIMAGRIDISVGSTMFAAMAIGASLMSGGGLDPLVGALVVLGVGAMIGLVHGVLAVVVGIDSLILTLGTMIALRGIALAVVGGTVIPLPESYVALSQMRIGPLYADSVLAVTLLVGCQILLTRTVFGRQLIGIGSDQRVAVELGFPVRARTISVFVICSSFAAFAGLVSAAQLGSVNTTFGAGMEFLGIAAVVLGGTSLFGGAGSFVPGALVGPGILVVIENGLTLLAASPYAYPIARGAVIFIAMYVDSLSAVSAGRRRWSPTWARALSGRISVRPRDSEGNAS